MLPRPRGTTFSLIAVAACTAGFLLFVCAELKGETRSSVVCREQLAAQRRDELASKLRKITGWSDLSFDQSGALRLGSKRAVGGSKTARELVTRAIQGTTAIIIEDASGRADVVFCRVNPGKWKRDAAGKPPVYVVLIDFADFEHLMGDEPALNAFDVGWGLLHELDHVVTDARDSTSPNRTGECEDHINQMRRECSLPLRSEYFFSFFPLTDDSAFLPKLVRLAFVEEDGANNRKKRYWLIWDANLVGGLDERKQIAALR